MAAAEHEDAAIAAAIAELGREAPIASEDLARGRATIAAFRRRRRKAIVGRTALLATALAAVAVLALVRVRPELWADLRGEASHGQSELTTPERTPEAAIEGAIEMPARARPPGTSTPTETVVPPPTIEPPAPADPPTAVEPTPRKPSAKPTPRATAGEMLAKARALAQARKLGPAVAAYEDVVEAWPDSAEARAAWVSIGRLQLARGRASAALRAFDRYLAGGSGTLAEEAQWGRIQALHAMGRAAERDAATAALARSVPGSVYLPKARALAEDRK